MSKYVASHAVFERVETPTPPTKPTPIPTPLIGFFVYQGDGQKPGRYRHDKVSRTFINKIGLRQTNETVVLRGFGDWGGKVITQLQLLWAWVDQFVAMIGWLVWGLYVQPGAGFQDTNEDPTDPAVGPFKQQSLSCGGNLFNRIGNSTPTPDGPHIPVQIQDFWAGPDPTLTYEAAPHLVTKQMLVGHDWLKRTYWITHKKNGDIVWPFVCRKGLWVAEKDIEYLPDLPFETTIDGYPLTIIAYCFQGSNTYGLATDGCWYVLEEMLVTGIGSVEFDRRVNCTGWIETSAPTVIGWKRTEYTLLEKALRFFGLPVQ